MRGPLLEITKERMENCAWLPKNLKNYKRFEDLELGGDLQARGIPVSIRKKLEDLVELHDREGSQTYREVVECCRGSASQSAISLLSRSQRKVMTPICYYLF